MGVFSFLHGHKIFRIIGYGLWHLFLLVALISDVLLLKDSIDWQIFSRSLYFFTHIPVNIFYIILGKTEFNFQEFVYLAAIIVPIVLVLRYSQKFIAAHRIDKLIALVFAVIPVFIFSMLTFFTGRGDEMSGLGVLIDFITLFEVALIFSVLYFIFLLMRSCFWSRLPRKSFLFI